MNARKLLYVVGALSPALLLALLGISGRFLTLPWQTPEYGEDVQKDIYAYRQAVNAVQAIHGKPEITDESLAQTAQVWIDGHLNGTLKDIPPAVSNDLGDQGVRKTIDLNKSRLLGKLIRRSDQLAEEGRFDEAGLFLSQALLVAEAGKFSSPNNTATSSIIQNNSLHRLSTWGASMSDIGKEAVAKSISLVIPNPGKIEHNYHHFEVLAKVESPNHQGKEQSLDTLMASNGVAVFQQIGNDASRLVLFNSFRKAYIQEKKLMENLVKAATQMAPTQVEKESEGEMTLVVAQR